MSKPKKKAPAQKATRQERSFHGALHAAEKRFAKAIEERAVCHQRLAMLNVEIPRLEQTIMALSTQVGRPAPDNIPRRFNPRVAENVPMPPQVVSVTTPTIVPAGIPQPVTDFTGMASVPAASGEPEVELTDDENQFLEGGGSGWQ